MAADEDASGHPIPRVAAPERIERHWRWRTLLAPWVCRVQSDDPAPDGRIRERPAGNGDAPAITLARLNDLAARDAFLTAIFANRRLRAAPTPRQRDLHAMHAREKYLLMAHAPETYRFLGRMIAGTLDESPRQVGERYRRELVRALATPAGRARHTSALQHMAGYFKRGLPAADRVHMHAAIADFRAGLALLSAPLRLIGHAAEKTETAYIARQSYLAPYPEPLMLRTWL